MVLNPAMAELRDALDAAGIEHADEDAVDELGLFSQCTVWEGRDGSVTALHAYAITEDGEKVGVSLGWNLADMLEFEHLGARSMLTVPEALREYT